MHEIPMTSEERLAVDAVLELQRRRANQELSVRGLLSDWARFVEEVESGFAGSLEDYLEMATWRDSLEDVLRVAPPSLRWRLLFKLEPIDERFQRATRPASPGWVWHRRRMRVPRVLPGELRRDVEARGLLQPPSV